jgi:hypothetical protein
VDAALIVVAAPAWVTDHAAEGVIAKLAVPVRAWRVDVVAVAADTDVKPSTPASNPIVATAAAVTVELLVVSR